MTDPWMVATCFIAVAVWTVGLGLCAVAGMLIGVAWRRLKAEQGGTDAG